MWSGSIALPSSENLTRLCRIQYFCLSTEQQGVSAMVCLFEMQMNANERVTEVGMARGEGHCLRNYFILVKKMFPRAEFYFIRQWFWSIPTGTRVFDFVTKKPMSNDSGER